MVLRNSGRVGSRRFLEREAPVSEDAGAFLFLGYLSALPYTCLVLLAFLFFVLFCLFSWGQQIFSADYFILVKCFFFLSLLLGYYIVSYPYHIIYLASISSYDFLFLSLKVTLLYA